VVYISNHRKDHSRRVGGEGKWIFQIEKQYCFAQSTSIQARLGRARTREKGLFSPQLSVPAIAFQAEKE